MLKLAANLRWLFQEWPISQRYATAAAIGFKGIEMPNPYETPAPQLAQILDGLGLTMVQIATPADWARGVMGLAAVPGRATEFMDGVNTAIEYAARIGRPCIHVLLGTVPAEVEQQQWMDVLVANLARAADAAKKERITLTMEAVCTERNPAWALHRLDETVQVIKATGRDNLKLVFDTFHVQMEEGRLIDRLKAHYAHIGVIQFGNPPDRHEPGAGELDLFYFFDAVERLAWPGWISCEYVPSVETLGSLAWASRFGISIPRELQAIAAPSAANSPARGWRDMSR